MPKNTNKPRRNLKREALKNEEKITKEQQKDKERHTNMFGSYTRSYDTEPFFHFSLLRYKK